VPPVADTGTKLEELLELEFELLDERELEELLELEFELLDERELDELLLDSGGTTAPCRALRRLTFWYGKKGIGIPYQVLELESEEEELEELLEDAPAGGGAKLANSPSYAPSVTLIVVLVLAAVAYTLPLTTMSKALTISYDSPAASLIPVVALTSGPRVSPNAR